MQDTHKKAKNQTTPNNKRQSKLQKATKKETPSGFQLTNYQLPAVFSAELPLGPSQSGVISSADGKWRCSKSSTSWAGVPAASRGCQLVC